MNELKMAMIVAQRTWTGTSIYEGAEAVLRKVYGPHECNNINGKCGRCGKILKEQENG